MQARRFSATVLFSMALLSACCAVSWAQPESKKALNQSDEEIRIERLAGLGKLWGAVKYLHPHLAYRAIDWDKALIDAIPKVNSAKTQAEYLAAVNQMLSLLGDQNTRAEIKTGTGSPPPAQAASDDKKPVRMENGVLLIDPAQIAIINYQGSPNAYDSLIEVISQSVPNAKAVIIDVRLLEQNGYAGEFFFGSLLRQILPQMLDRNITLGTRRSRTHDGYASQKEGSDNFSYYSSLSIVNPEIISGQNKTKSLPMVFILGSNSPEAVDVLGGLQAAGLAFIIQEGQPAPKNDIRTYNLQLPDSIKVMIKTWESVNPDSSIGLLADTVVRKTSGEDLAMREAVRLARRKNTGISRRRSDAKASMPLGLKEKAYPEMEFPGPEYRLLALFRFWIVINYFFPYKDLIGSPWEPVLQRYIPKFEAVKDAADYQLTVRELVTEIHDTHGKVENANASDQKLGMFLPPVLVRFVEKQAVITKLLADSLPVKIGEVILTIDGEPVEKRQEYLARFISSSTPQALMRYVHLALLRGQKNSPANLRIKGIDGKVREASLERTLSTTDPKLRFANRRSTPVVRVLPSGYGYVDLGRLEYSQVDSMFEAVKNTPAVIFDMRGYPNGTAWPIAPRLTEKHMPNAALLSYPLLEAQNIWESGSSDGAAFTFWQKLDETTDERYKGKVVMLINEEAASQAEHTCLFFEAATEVTFIGTPTMGTDGNITYTVLPGNLLVRFTGLNVRHADGRQLHRVGIQPNILVAPTIKGVAAGKDEILEAAVKFLDKTGQKKSASK